MRSPLEEIKIHFNPQQASGTPSPSNVLPITGWTALDVIDNGKNFWNNSDVIYGVWTSSTESVSVYERGCRTQDIAASSGMVFTLWYNATQPYSASIVELDAKKGFLKRTHTQWNGAANPAPLSCTLTANTRYVYAQVAKNYDGAITYEILSTFNMQLDKGSSTSYEAFKGNKIPVSWSELGTVYGGWANESGEVWATHVSVDISTLGDFTLNTGLSGVDRFLISKPSNCKNNGSSLVAPSVYSDIYRTESASTANTNRDTWVVTILNGSVMFYTPFGTYSSSADFKNAMTGHSFIYELTTPVLVGTISPITLKTLVGANNIWSSANGDVDVRYWTH